MILQHLSWAKRPETASNACGGTNAENGATGATCAAFVKILNPSNNYATELFTTLDMTEISSTEWSSHGYYSHYCGWRCW